MGKGENLEKQQNIGDKSGQQDLAQEFIRLAPNTDLVIKLEQGRRGRKFIRIVQVGGVN